MTDRALVTDPRQDLGIIAMKDVCEVEQAARRLAHILFGDAALRNPRYKHVSSEVTSFTKGIIGKEWHLMRNKIKKMDQQIQTAKAKLRLAEEGTWRSPGSEGGEIMTFCITALRKDRGESPLKVLRDYTMALMELQQLLTPLEDIAKFEADIADVQAAKEELQDALSSRAMALLLPADERPDGIMTTAKKTSKWFTA